MIVVRAGSERDYPVIARIQQLCPEAAQWPVGDYAGFHLLLATVDSVPAGFCAWRRTSREEAELLNLGVIPALRRHGVASALLEALIDEARGEIFLEVAEPNLSAIALYRKHGWAEIAVRPGYYDAGRTSAIVMKKSSW